MTKSQSVVLPSKVLSSTSQKKNEDTSTVATIDASGTASPNSKKEITTGSEAVPPSSPFLANLQYVSGGDIENSSEVPKGITTLPHDDAAATRTIPNAAKKPVIAVASTIGKTHPIVDTLERNLNWVAGALPQETVDGLNNSKKKATPLSDAATATIADVKPVPKITAEGKAHPPPVIGTQSSKDIPLPLVQHGPKTSAEPETNTITLPEQEQKWNHVPIRDKKKGSVLQKKKPTLNTTNRFAVLGRITDDSNIGKAAIDEDDEDDDNERIMELLSALFNRRPLRQHARTHFKITTTREIPKHRDTEIILKELNQKMLELEKSEEKNTHCVANIKYAML